MAEDTQLIINKLNSILKDARIPTTLQFSAHSNNPTRISLIPSSETKTNKKFIPIIEKALTENCIELFPDQIGITIKLTAQNKNELSDIFIQAAIKEAIALAMDEQIQQVLESKQVYMALCDIDGCLGEPFRNWQKERTWDQRIQKLSDDDKQSLLKCFSEFHKNFIQYIHQQATEADEIKLASSSARHCLEIDRRITFHHGGFSSIFSIKYLHSELCALYEGNKTTPKVVPLASESEVTSTTSSGSTAMITESLPSSAKKLITIVTALLNDFVIPDREIGDEWQSIEESTLDGSYIKKFFNNKQFNNMRVAIVYWGSRTYSSARPDADAWADENIKLFTKNGIQSAFKTFGEGSQYIDKYKISLLFSVINYGASQRPNDKLTIDCFDDREDILLILAMYFERHPEKLPHNVKLRFVRYDSVLDVTKLLMMLKYNEEDGMFYFGGKKGQPVIIQGTGEVYQDQTVLKLAVQTEYETCKMRLYAQVDFQKKASILEKRLPSSKYLPSVKAIADKAFFKGMFEVSQQEKTSLLLAKQTASPDASTSLSSV